MFLKYNIRQYLASWEANWRRYSKRTFPMMNRRIPAKSYIGLVVFAHSLQQTMRFFRLQFLLSSLRLSERSVNCLLGRHRFPIFFWNFQLKHQKEWKKRKISFSHVDVYLFTFGIWFSILIALILLHMMPIEMTRRKRGQGKSERWYHHGNSTLLINTIS